MASDRITLPAVKREFRSPSGAHTLVVETANNWKTPVASATLYRTQGGQPMMLWTRQLPQEYGPREALVSDLGQVLFIDEWINVDSRFALMLLDRDQRVVSTYAFEAVFSALGVGHAEVAANARSGTWLGGSPSLAADGLTARIPAAGRTLVVSLADGRLSVTP